MSSVDPSAVADAVDGIRQRIHALAGDRPVHLVAVTKGFGADAIVAAAAAGCTMVGESYGQELIAKVADLADLDDLADASDPVPATRPAIHFIGQLQTNKVRQLVGIVDVWQTVDRVSLVDEIARRAAGATIMIQVNATGEPAKGGCHPSEVDELIVRARGAGLDVDGLMTIGPTSQNRADTAAAFATVRSLVDDHGLVSCSMGMSDDMDLAIEHGATHVRIGSAVFGARPHQRAPIR